MQREKGGKQGGEAERGREKGEKRRTEREREPKTYLLEGLDRGATRGLQSAVCGPRGFACLSDQVSAALLQAPKPEALDHIVHFSQ